MKINFEPITAQSPESESSGRVNFSPITAADRIEKPVKDQRDFRPSAEDVEKYSPTQGMSQLQKFGAGMGKVFADTKLGFKQLGAEIGHAIGAVSDETVRDLRKEATEVHLRDQALMDTGAGFAGNITGNVAALALPGGILSKVGQVTKLPALVNAGRAMAMPKTIGGMAAQGAAFGGVQPVGEGESRLTNMGLGGLAGAAGGGIGKLVGRIAAPLAASRATAASQDVANLVQEGWRPSFGQSLGNTLPGRAVRAMERKSQSLPIGAGGIAETLQGSKESWNKTVLNRVLSPIGKELPEGLEAGRGAIQKVHELVDDAYKTAYQGLKGKADDVFLNQVTDILDDAVGLPEGMYQKLEKYITDNVLERFAQTGELTGEALTRLNQQLSKDVSKFYRGGGDSRFFGESLSAVKKAVDEMLVRVAEESGNTVAAESLRNANKAFAMLVRVQHAASRVGADSGVFTPQQLLGASRQADRSARKAATAKGKALLQDVAERGKQLLGPEVPNSGTADRLLTIAGPAAVALNPALLAVPALTKLYGSKAGQALLKALVHDRPDMMLKAGQGIQKAAPFGGLLGAGSALAQ